jgi:hypothetical protein
MNDIGISQELVQKHRKNAGFRKFSFVSKEPVLLFVSLWYDKHPCFDVSKILHWLLEYNCNYEL